MADRIHYHSVPCGPGCPLDDKGAPPGPYAAVTTSAGWKLDVAATERRNADELRHQLADAEVELARVRGVVRRLYQNVFQVDAPSDARCTCCVTPHAATCALARLAVLPVREGLREALQIADDVHSLYNGPVTRHHTAREVAALQLVEAVRALRLMIDADGRIA